MRLRFRHCTATSAAQTIHAEDDSLPGSQESTLILPYIPDFPCLYTANCGSNRLFRTDRKAFLSPHGYSAGSQSNTGIVEGPEIEAARQNTNRRVEQYGQRQMPGKLSSVTIDVASLTYLRKRKQTDGPLKHQSWMQYHLQWSSGITHRISFRTF